MKNPKKMNGSLQLDLSHLNITDNNNNNNNQIKNSDKTKINNNIRDPRLLYDDPRYSPVPLHSIQFNNRNDNTICIIIYI